MSGGEDKITSWFASQSAAPEGLFPIGIGDDMAQVAVEGGSVLVTTDMLLDGVHFDLSSASFEEVGYKAMAASLSDCAAMATIPVCAVCAVALPKGTDAASLKQLHDGITRAGDMFGCYLIGGEITSWSGDGRFAVNVTMLSKPGKSLPVRRDGARAGDVICVTGSLGGAIKGRHLSFVPRVNEALRIVEIATVSAMMDISDGISTDLKRICDQSGVGAQVFAESLPVSEAAAGESDPVSCALNDGEDFELLFTLKADEYEKLAAAWDMDTPVSKIGVVNEQDNITILTQAGEINTLAAKGYDHL